MAKRKPLFMESTQVAPEKTAAEITACLISSGARQIASDYDEKGRCTGLRFVVMVGKTPLPFALPVRIEPVFQIINGRRDSWNRSSHVVKDREQAERVAWRQLLRWVQAQLAMIETGMVEVHEVFLPYLQQNGQTLFQVFMESHQKALPPAPGGSCAA